MTKAFTVDLFPSASDISAVMRQIQGVTIGVLGDFCIDAYWDIDSHVHETSIETGKEVLHVCEQRYSPGGAGNVVVNLAALGVANIKVFGVIGNDVFGRELTRLLIDLGADTQGLLIQQTDWDTPIYGKPLLDSVEQQRLDFGVFNTLADTTWSELQACVLRAADQVDLLVVNQQLPQGWCNSERGGWMLRVLLAQWKSRHLVDSRHHVKSFSGACLKLNQNEATQLLDIGDYQPGFGDEKAISMAHQLAAIGSEAVFMTRGERGMVACQDNQLYEVPGVHISGPTDTVGAGDAATAMLAACRAIKLPAARAAVLANLAASITVRKLNQTGTASPAELLVAARHLAYVYHPTLADESRLATYVDTSDIEVVDAIPLLELRAAVFDHDGTISTLRQGWEQVMEPMMIRAIMGKQYATADSLLFGRVQNAVRQFIEQSTGIQTIAQMDALVGMITDFDITPPAERLDAWGYKQAYNDALMKMVDARLQRLARGELTGTDFIMKGAVEFLGALRAAGVKLYLVSGTDEADAMNEAGLLGYAGLFDGGIHGAKPGSRADTKEGIIQLLLDELAQSAVSSEGESICHLVVTGDGPVEIRLARKYGALPLGVASTEERRFGLNVVKRRRLIRAGAGLIVPDFSQWLRLASILHL